MKSNDELVDYLINRGQIKTTRTEQAFREVDRADFMPEEKMPEAYNDRALPIGEDATISAPHMVAINTELLAPQEGEKILEIGSGSGYQAAILSELASHVTGVEILGELVEKSRELLAEKENVDILHGDGLEEVEGKFDRILYSCAVDNLEEALEYLKGPRVVLAPVDEGRVQILKKYSDGQVTDHGRVRFVKKQS